MYISLGSSCSTIYHIAKYSTKSETLFFDWLISNKFSDVIKVFNNYKNIENLINKNSITVTGIVDEEIKIKFDKLEECYSLHDIPNNYNDNDIENFLEKYKRRLKRIVECIEKNQETIYFLRISKYLISKTQIHEFYKCVSNINKHCNYYLVNISYGHNSHNSVRLEDNCFTINLRENTEYKDWTLSHLDWKFVFDSIKKS